MTIEEQKQRLRKEMLLKRAALPKHYKEKYDRWICNSLWNITAANDFKTIHCYLPINTEIDIKPFIQKLLDESLTVVTSKILEKGQLQHVRLSSLDQLEKGIHGTVYPKNAIEYFGSYDLIIVPGLGFTSSNYRLGYGGGYYDTFLANHTLTQTIGVFYPFQECENIPIETHDIPLKDILVDKKFLVSGM